MNIALTTTTVTVEANHVYHGTVHDVVGLVRVHDGPTMEAPVVSRLRDTNRSFLWTPREDGERTILVSGWPGQPGTPAVTVLHLGPAQRAAGTAGSV